MKANEAISKVEPYLSKERFSHTVRVAKTARELAILYNEPPDRAELAAIFHDYAKDRSLDMLKEQIKTSSLPQDLLQYDHELWHAPVGSILVEREYGITDAAILAAIRYHTTGRKGMSKLELIVFLADYIEPKRDFPGVQSVREKAQQDLLAASWMVSRNTIQFLIQKKVQIYPDTFFAYNDLTKRLNSF